jgi:hypothetical protein
MGSVLAKNWNPDENFWSLNPMFKTIKVFKRFYDHDKTKRKAPSSKVMWGVAMLLDPNEENTWRNLSMEEKKELIASDVIEDKKFDWESGEILELIDTYEKHALTATERSLRELEIKLLERAAFIRKTEYTLDTVVDGKIFKGTAAQLDKMVVETDKIYTQIEKMKERLHKEALSGTLKGGAAESASEKGLI